MPVQEKIRVLIVDDITETRENIQRMLQFDTNIEVIGSARGGREAIDLCQKLKPDVVVMDINMPDMDGITATEAIRRRSPFIQVVILSVQSDPSYMRRAMLAGARDFLAKPPSIDEFTAAVKRAGILAQEEYQKFISSYPTAQAGVGGQAGVLSQNVKGRIVSIYSPKGGVGVTTIATNLALSLKAEDNKVLLVDGNLQFGDVAVFLNEQVKKSVADLTPRIDELDPEVVEDVTITHVSSGVRVLAAPPKPEMAESVLPEQFSKLLQYMRQHYSFVIVDTASYLNEVMLASLEISDLVILITTQDIPSIKNASSFLSLIDALGIKRDRVAFVMNRYDKRVAISPERVSESLHQPIVAAIPYDSLMVSSSVNRGVPFMLDNKIHPVAKSIIALGDLIKERLAKSEEEQAEPVKK